jgi:hypothetical protein
LAGLPGSFRADGYTEDSADGEPFGHASACACRPLDAHCAIGVLAALAGVDAQTWLVVDHTDDVLEDGLVFQVDSWLR